MEGQVSSPWIWMWMSDLRSEGDIGSLWAQGSTNTEALRWIYARNNEETDVGGQKWG